MVKINTESKQAKLNYADSEGNCARGIMSSGQPSSTFSVTATPKTTPPRMIEEEIPKAPFKSIVEARSFCNRYQLKLNCKTIPNAVDRASAVALEIDDDPKLAHHRYKEYLQEKLDQPYNPPALEQLPFATMPPAPTPQVLQRLGVSPPKRRTHAAAAAFSRSASPNALWRAPPMQHPRALG